MVSTTAENGGEGGEWEPLLSFLDQYQDLMDSTADIFKSEISNIHGKKVDRNRAMLEKESRPEAVRLAKNIVSSYQDIVKKLCKDMQQLSSSMGNELAERYNLPHDWNETSSSYIRSSHTGSDISEPVSRNQEERKSITSPSPNNKNSKIITTQKKVCDRKEEEAPTEKKSNCDTACERSSESILPDPVADPIIVNTKADRSCRSTVQESDEEKDMFMEFLQPPTPPSLAEDLVEVGTSVQPSTSIRTSIADEEDQRTEGDQDQHTGRESQQEADDNAELASPPKVVSDESDFDDSRTVVLPSRSNRKTVPEKEKKAESQQKEIREIPNSQKGVSDDESDFDDTKTVVLALASSPRKKVVSNKENQQAVDANTQLEDSVELSNLEKTVSNDDFTSTEHSKEELKLDSDKQKEKVKENQSTKSEMKQEENQREKRDRKLLPSLGDEERDAMRGVIGTSSESESESSTSRLSLSRRRREKKINLKESKNKVDISTSNDPKLKEDAAVVKVRKLDAAIEESLANDGFVLLKDYGNYKKRTCQELERGNSSSDNDSNGSVSDSAEKLQMMIKKLTKTSLLCTKKYATKRNKEVENSPQKRRSKRKVANSNKLREFYSSPDTDSESEGNNSIIMKPTKPKSMLEQDVPLSLLSDSGSEDLIEAEESKSVNEKKSQAKSKSKSTDSKSKKKTYIGAELTSDESDDGARRNVVSSDSEDQRKRTKGKRVKVKKEQNSDDSTDSDFISKTKVTKKRGNKKRKQDSDSDIDLISINSSKNSASDSDSDFKSRNRSSKRRRDSSPEQNKKTGNKKKRRRVFTKDSSDDSDSDEIKEIPVSKEAETSASQEYSSRKNIRKIISSRDLSRSTKEAERDEEDRRKRLSDRQKLFNGVHKAPESDKIDGLVLDVDPETKNPVIQVDQSIAEKLKPHQAEGIRFMYNACFESIEMIKENKVPGGCILAHCMGLGKTLQSVAFMHTLLTNKICGIKTVLVICPLSTVSNWYNEAKNWTQDAEMMKIHKLYEMKSSGDSKKDYLRGWYNRGGVGILHYEMFRVLVDPKGKSKMKESVRKVVKETLLDPGPDMVIADEGHLLKNCKSLLSLAVNSITTHRRVVLTGTPLQNNLVEYHTMMNFVKPNLLGSLPEFTNRFVNPIKNGQHADSTEHDVKIMKRRAHVLHRKLEGCVQRCDYSILSPYLPPKYEYIINVKLSEKQEQLYKHYLQHVVNQDPDAKRKRLLKYYSELVKVWSHPIALTMRKRTNEEGITSESEGSMKDFIDDGSGSEDIESGEGSNDGPKQKSKRRTRAQAAQNPEDENSNNLEDALGFAGNWWTAIFKSKAEMYDVELSGKLIILQEILKTCEGIGDKVLVFSQFLTSLDIIEEFLRDWDAEAVKKEKEKPISFPLGDVSTEGRWRRNMEYFRIDGTVKASDRHRDCEIFNRKSSFSKAKLFLISTKAGGLGINLHGANRVVIFDASWNPSQDLQSIFRVYRFGQDKPCYVYRLIAKGTMEEKILRRQITKLSLAFRVVDEHQIQRHFKFDDVNEMFRYDEEDPSTGDPVLAVPKDRLLADLLMSHRTWIRSYEEFDSLLENKVDEGLTNEEKEVAWEEYRLESERQRQSGYGRNSSTAQAETYVKVRTKLTTNYPGASKEQLDEAAQVALQVIEKIREAVLYQNQMTTDAQKAYVAPYIEPLKMWLAQSIQSGGNDGSVTAVPATGPILKPLPPQFYTPIPVAPPVFANPIPNPYNYHQRPRPPVSRRTPIRMHGNAFPRPHPNINNLQSAFQNIVSNTLPGMRPSMSIHDQMLPD